MTEAAATVQAIFHAGFLPSALEIADRYTLEAARRDKGISHVPAGSAHLLVDVDGQEATVREELGALQQLMASLHPNSLVTATTDEECESLWALRRYFSDALRATGLTKLNEDVVVPRSRLVELIEFTEALQKQHGFPIACFGHAGDGNIHVNIMVADYETAQAQVECVLDQLFQQVLNWGGVVTGEHGIGLAKKRWWPQAADEVSRETHRTIKEALDPIGILNPGKFLD